jgi:hypothetical protein
MARRVRFYFLIWKHADECPHIRLQKRTGDSSLQWKHAIGLEMQGLKHSRGSVTAHVRKKLSAPRSYKRADLHKHLVDSIDDINKQMGVSA